MDDPSVESNKKTFLKAQIPKMENEIKNTKSRVKSLLEAEELDPRGEWYVLAKKLMKQSDTPCGEVFGCRKEHQLVLAVVRTVAANAIFSAFV